MDVTSTSVLLRRGGAAARVLLEVGLCFRSGAWHLLPPWPWLPLSP
jgi:hypothetical protein